MQRKRIFDSYELYLVQLDCRERFFCFSMVRIIVDKVLI